MGKLNYVVGTLILISGFVIYHLGFFVAFHELIPTPLAAIFPAGPYLDLIGIALEFGGGIMGIIGFLIYISNVISAQRKETLSVIARLGATHEKPTITRLRCKFCGTEIAEQAVFCPVCNRSQR